MKIAGKPCFIVVQKFARKKFKESVESPDAPLIRPMKKEHQPQLILLNLNKKMARDFSLAYAGPIIRYPDSAYDVGTPHTGLEPAVP